MDIKAGDTITRAITVKKVKNETPTIITVDGRTYILQHDSQFKRT